MNPMNTQTNKPTKRIPHVHVLSTFAAVCLIQSLIANVAFAQAKYAPFNYPDVNGGSYGPTGIRSAGGQNVFVTGSFHPATPTPTGTPTPTPIPTCSPAPSPASHGLLYEGPLSGNGTWTVLDYPSSPGITVTGTVLYGPDALPPNNVRIVGSYTKCEDEGTGVRNHGLLYEGPTDGSGTWQTIDYGGPLRPGEQVLNTIVHSTMGGLAVGNFDTNLLIGRAFVYDIAANHWTELIKPSVSITAYGIWYNGGTSYTIAGGYSDANPNGIDHGYLANWDSATQQASDWTPYDFDNGPHTHVEVSHFDGITTDNQGGFYLTGEWAAVGQQFGGFFAHIPQMPHRAFGDARWRDIEYPSSVLTTGNTVFENNVFGIYFVNLDSPFSGYIANVQGHR
jgi:hypothetical protein